MLLKYYKYIIKYYTKNVCSTPTLLQSRDGRSSEWQEINVLREKPHPCVETRRQDGPPHKEEREFGVSLHQG